MPKGKRWKKGQSSSSNPTANKHRENAKNNRNFFNFGLPSNNSKSSQLTSQALAQLNAANNEHQFDSKSLISDNESVGTFESWASQWSDCTNATFNRIHKYWRSNSSMHKEILAVLAAITEVIKENNGQGSEVEYFAALMTGLEPIKDNEETASAFLYLIALAIKKVPENVLKAKFDELLKTFVDILDTHGETASNFTLIKSCLICICWLLKCQDKKAWSDESTVRAYSKMLSFVTHPKPKIRRFAQQAVTLVLNSCSSRTGSSDVAAQVSSLTAEFCLKSLSGESAEENSGNRNQVDFMKNALHLLTLLKHIVRHFQADSLKMTCEFLLRMISLKDLMVAENCFQVFYHLFNSQTNHLTANFNAKIINALYDFQPSEQSPPQVINWLAVMDAAIRSLNRLSKPLCMSHLPHLVQRFMQAFSSSHSSVHVATARCLNSTLEQCIRTNIDLLVDDFNSSTEMTKSTLHKVFIHLEAGLSYQFHTAWPHIIKIIACAFGCFANRKTFPVVANCVHSLANLRESEQFDYIREADIAIGRAIRTFGPKLIIECIRLNITGDETSFEYPRSWLLPLLKENIDKTELAYFVKEIMPLAKKLRVKSEMFVASRQAIEAKIFENLQNQFWSLLPGFCHHTTDFSDSFKNLAKTLGETLEKCPDLRVHVLKALRTLILSNTDENKATMSKYAKNYLPIMFNLYTTDPRLDDSIRQSIIDTVRHFLTITDIELINTYLSQCMVNFDDFSKKYDEWIRTSVQDVVAPKPAEDVGGKKRVVFDFKKTERETSSKTTAQECQPYLFAKYAFLDLIGVLTKYANRSTVDTVYQLAHFGISNKQQDKTVQKKCYKILDTMLESGKPAESRNEIIGAYVVEKFESIAKSLVTSLSECSSGAKVPRLKCLNELMTYVTQPAHKTLIQKMLPEVILSIREVNQKSRDASLALLNSMLKLWQKLGHLASPAINEADSLNEFIRFIMVSLAGSVNMVSFGCLALSSLSFEFRENLSGPIIKELVDASCHLIRRSEHKEVILASLNLLKILCGIFQSTILAQYLDKICDAIHSLHEKRAPSSTSTTTKPIAASPDTTFIAPINKSQRIKTLVKMVLKKLMKKFTYEIIVEKIFANESSVAGGKMDTGDILKPALNGVVRHGLENLLVNLKKLIEKDRLRKMEEQTGAKKSSNNDAADLISVYTAATGKDNPKSVVLNEIGDLLKESDSEDEEETDAKSSRSRKDRRRSKKSLNQAWLQENADETPLDLLDPMAIKSVLASRPNDGKKKEKKEKNGGFKTSADGKLVIDIDDEDDSSDQDDMKSKASRKASRKGRNHDELDEMMDTLSLTRKSTKSANSAKLKQKRRLDDDSDDEVADTKSKFSYKSGGTGIHRNLSKKTVDYGAEYKAKKSTGDVKIKNRPDPYAYIPFNPEKLNKRKRAKFSGEFKGYVKTGKPNANKKKT